MSVSLKEKNIKIIKNRGEARETVSIGGKTVKRVSHIYVPEYGVLVVTAPYDNHFIYETPDKKQGSAILCTCGSPGVISLDTPQKMFICLHHASTGMHTNSS